MAQAMAVPGRPHPWRVPVALSLFLHALVVALLASNLSFCRHEVVLPPVPEHVRAVVVDRNHRQPAPRVMPEPRPQPLPEPLPEPPAPVKPVEKPVPRPAESSKPVPKPPKQAAPAVKPAQPAAVKPSPKPAVPAIDLGALLAQEDAVRRASEEAQAAAARKAEAQKPAVQDSRDVATVREYESLIAMEVEKRWNRPPGARAGMTARLRITLIPGGEVIDVRVVRSSGNSAFDRSAENAVRMAGRLPVPADPGLFNTYFRQINFVFDPKDLNQ